MKSRSTLGGLMLCALSLSGQVAFEAASVKVSRTSFKMDDAGRVDITAGSVSMSGVTLRSCLMWAYRVREDQVSGPLWLGTERYDILAKAGAPVGVGELRQMMQALLTDRFGVRFHHETRSRPAFVISVSEDGPKLTAPTGAGPGKLGVQDNALLFQHSTLEEVAERLSVTLGRPVLDRTGIEGAFDVRVPLPGDVVEMKLAAERATLAGESIDPSPYVAALRKAGLRLEARKAPIEILVIDHAERAPTAN